MTADNRVPVTRGGKLVIVGRIPAGAVVLHMPDGSRWSMDPDNAESIAMQMLDEVRQIRENAGG